MKHEIKLLLENDVPGYGKAGERITFALSPSDVHDATELSTYLAGYKPFGNRADEASKVILVDNDSDKYRTFNSDDAFRRVTVKTSVQGKVAEVDPKSDLATYNVVYRGIGSFVSDATQGQSGNAYDPKFAATRRCRRAIDLDRELDVWALLGTTTNWDSSVRTALGAGYNWDGGANSDPIDALQTAIEASWQQVTDIWMNQQLAHAFMKHSEVRSYMVQFLGDSAVSGMNRQVAFAGTQMVDLAIPGLPPIHVLGSKVKNESTGVLDYILASGTCVLLTTVPGTPTDGEEIASTYTYRKRGPSGNGYNVREIRIETRGVTGGTMVIVWMADDEVMTGNKCGGIITGCHS